MWGKIICWAKNLNMTPRDVLWEISYENLIMLNAATPQYDDEKDNWDPTIDANEPGRFEIDEEEYI